MKKITLHFFTLLSLAAHAQNVGIGTAVPQKKLTVNGSIMLDQTNTNDGAIDSAALVFGTNGAVGIASKKTSAGWQNGLSLFTNSQNRLTVTSTGLIGINNTSPASQLHVDGSIRSSADMWAGGLGRFDGRLAIGNAGLPEYKLYVSSGNSYFGGNISSSGSTTLSGTLNVSGLTTIDDNLRVNGRLGLFGPASAVYGLYVHINDSYFQGAVSTGGNVSVGSTLNVSGDGIVDNNFRVNGRIGINGATHASYGLIVNNANSYFQGNTTVSGSTTVQGNATIQGSINLQGNVTIQGNGHVRSNGSSNLRVAFVSYSTNDVYDGHGEEAKTVTIPEFTGTTDNIRVVISQFEPAGPYNETSYFKWYVYDVNNVNHTCKIRIINDHGSIHVLNGTFQLMIVGKD